jgi:hypothetical protein
MLWGSHDSCSSQVNDPFNLCCVIWAKTQDLSLSDQFSLGIRLFDLRYSFNQLFVISHTIPSRYTLQEAIQELIQCSINSNEYIYIRLKRDSTSPPLPSFGNALQSIQINSQPLSDYIVTYDGSTLWSFLRESPNGPTVVLYSDNETLHEDHVPSSWIFPQLFDVIETWEYSTVEEAVQRVYEKKFAENGLPKAIFLDFSSILPPEVSFTLLWNQVKEEIKRDIKNGTIQCVMSNQIQYLHELL